METKPLSANVHNIMQRIKPNTYRSNIVFKLSDETLQMIQELQNQISQNKRNVNVLVIEQPNVDDVPIKEIVCKKPNFLKKTGVDEQLAIIRSTINKITDKNYMDLLDVITDTIDKIETMTKTKIIAENSDADMSVISAELEKEMVKISSFIFDIASSNQFYSNQYAQLYGFLQDIYPVFSQTLKHHLINFKNDFTNIICIDPVGDYDYDQFCNCNKQNDKRLALTNFYLNLMNNNVIAQEDIIFITFSLLSLINEMKDIPDKQNENYELAKNIHILFDPRFYKKYKNPSHKINGIDMYPFVITLIDKNKKESNPRHKNAGINMQLVCKFIEMINK